MAYTINRVILVGGNLTKDVEVGYTNSGKSIARFSIAMNRKTGKNQNGSYKEEVDFFNIEAWELPDGLIRCLARGQKVAIEGELRQQRWVDGNGQNQQRLFVTAKNIILLGGQKEGPDTRVPRPNRVGAPADDDIPF